MKKSAYIKHIAYSLISNDSTIKLGILANYFKLNIVPINTISNAEYNLKYGYLSKNAQLHISSILINKFSFINEQLKNEIESFVKGFSRHE